MKRVYARYLEIRHEDAEAIEERSDIHFNAGVACFYTGDFRRAIALYSEIRVSPDFHGYYANRGSAHDALKEHTQVLDDYARAIQWNPDDANVHYNRRVTCSRWSAGRMHCVILKRPIGWARMMRRYDSISAWLAIISAKARRHCRPTTAR